MKRTIACVLAVIGLFAACNFSSAIGEAGSVGFWEGLKNYIYNDSVQRFLEKRGILTDDTEAYDYANEFLTAALEHDLAAMKVLFAPNAIAEISEEQFDQMLDDFIDYFQADSFALEMRIGPNASECLDNGNKSKELKGPLEVEAGESKYRIAIKCVPRDDWEQGNIGIWSIYIIEESKDSDPDQHYYGDLLYTSGIYFDIPRPE